MTMSINRSLAHGLEILLLFDTSQPVFTVSEISKRLRYSQSKAYRLVRTLIKYHLVKEIPGTAQYSLGLNALRLGLVAQQNINIAAIARPFMKELSLLTKETVLLTAVSGTKGIVLERVESEEPIRYSVFQPGASIPLHCGASSKILMAHLGEDDWNRIMAIEGLTRYTPNTITNVKQLKGHLREIREKGYAFSDQEVDRDVRAVAAPILNGTTELAAGLSVAGPAYRINKRKVNSLAAQVMRYAQKISSQLGYGLRTTDGKPSVTRKGGQKCQ
jgi:DNA-binding IclR family transcriptional regulator